MLRIKLLFRQSERSAARPGGAALLRDSDFDVFLTCPAVLEIPRQVRKTVQQGNRSHHHGGPQQEIGGQNVQHGGGVLRLGKEQIVCPRPDDPVGPQRDRSQNQQRAIGFYSGFHRRTHPVHEDHVKYRDIPQRVLQPELVIAEAGGTGIGDDRGSEQGKYGTGKQPEIADIKQGLGFSDHHIAAEHNSPATNRDGQMVDGVWPQRGNGNQPPVIGHLGEDQGKGQQRPQLFFVLAAAELFPVLPNQQDHTKQDQNGKKMGQSEIGEFHFCAFTEEILQKRFQIRSPLEIK